MHGQSVDRFADPRRVCVEQRGDAEAATREAGVAGQCVAEVTDTDKSDGAALIQSFYAYGAGFFGGVYVSVGNLNGDKYADIVTSADTVGHVKGFDGQTNATLFSFMTFVDRAGSTTGSSLEPS